MSLPLGASSFAEAHEKWSAQVIGTEPETTQRAAGSLVRALVLVDYFNSFPGPPTTEVIQYEIVTTLRTVLAVAPTVRAIDFRYYGGWYDSSGLSQAASELMGLLSVGDPFPLALGKEPASPILRGTLRLAERLLAAPSWDLGETLRRRAGVPSFRLAMSGRELQCPVPQADCGMRRVVRLTKSPGKNCWVPSCPETVASAFFVKEQKMVDSMLVCDLLHAAASGDNLLVVVETADTDIVPALVQAVAMYDTPVWLRDKNRDWDQNRLSDLQAAGIGLL